MVKQTSGYIESLHFDGFHYYPANVNCSWLFIGQPNHSFTLKFSVFELDFQQRDGLYLYNGYNSSAPLLDKFSGSRRRAPEWTSPGTVLFVQFVALDKPRSVGFSLYFESNPTRVRCQSSQIACRNGYKCAEVNQYCNGVDDCEDGTDEQNCPTSLEDLSFNNSCGSPQIPPIEQSFRIVGGTAAKPGKTLFTLLVSSQLNFNFTLQAVGPGWLTCD